MLGSSKERSRVVALASYAIRVGQIRLRTSLSTSGRVKRYSYLEVTAQEFAKVLGLDSQDVFVHLPLFVAAGDGQVREEALRKETVTLSVSDQRLPKYRPRTP
jgi:hypothetical protein